MINYSAYAKIRCISPKLFMIIKKKGLDKTVKNIQPVVENG